MVRFNSEQLHDAMKKRNNIRNISIIAHIDSGKSTCTDSLLQKAGIISSKDSGSKRFMDTRDDEQSRCITIKSTGVSLFYEVKDQSSVPEGSEGNGFLVNLIDSPGHVDFSSEVTAALRVTDGAVVILDGINGVCVQTETVLRQAFDEMIVPVCLINKIDRLIFELQLSPEDLYQKLYSHVIHLNSVIHNYNKKMPEIVLDPRKGTVAFGCGKQGWGFSLFNMAAKWCGKLGMTKEELVEKLWGENYYSPKTNSWHDTPGTGRKRGFNCFVIEPIMSMIETLKSGVRADIEKKAKSIGAKIDVEWWEKPDILFKMVMMQFAPLADTMLEMIIIHLPSPVKAQSYRVDHLYTGPKDDVYYNAIKNCDPNGPLVMYVSKLFPTNDLSRFFAFGRVFSGTVSSRDVNIQRPEYVVGQSGSNSGLYTCKIQKTCVWMGSTDESIPDCPAGNTVALAGVDKFIVKTCTITDAGVRDAHNIRDMAFTVSPVVSVAVTCKNPADLPKFTRGLELLTKSDPLCVVKHEAETSEIVISGAGELHLEICIHDLREFYAKGVNISVSDPVVPYRETITVRSNQTSLAKSPNNHNRIYMIAEPLSAELVELLEKKDIHDRMDKKELADKLSNYGVPKNEGVKLWRIGEVHHGNMLIDNTKGVQYLNEIKDNCVNGMEWVTGSGPLCEEPCRGVKFSIQDVVLHADNIHRGGGQIIPASRSVCYASMLCAEPRLMEPVYLCIITCPNEMAGSIYGIVNQRRGEVFDESRGDNMATIKVYLPVAESIGFTEYLRSETGGKAFPQCQFSHWAVINSDPLEEGSKANEIVKSVRKRKGLKEEIPKYEDYNCKL